MSILIGIHSISKSFGSHILFKDLSFSLCQGDRIGLIGPNGAGKSTLLKILMDAESADKGTISRRQTLRVGYVSQAPDFPSLSLAEVLMQKAPANQQYEWEVRARVLLGKMQFPDPTQNAAALSGGWKKRLDIVRALMEEPDILFLDEPTNHLDLEGILDLEKFLAKEKTAYLVVSHDRYFLENVTNKIMELNPCYPQGILVSEGNMSTYMANKEAFLQTQQQQQRSLASAVRDEVDWLRRSPKARTTKSQSRIDRAHLLINELAEVTQRNRETKVNLEFSSSDRETRKLLVACNLTKALGGKTLFTGLDLTLSPGMRLGIAGKNGTGKTTLLKLLANQLPADQGTLKYADEIKLVYFDQHREQISGKTTLKRALSPTSDTVMYQGQSIHVNGWAKKFLFSVDRLEMPISYLSGGERARILIARLMLEPADILFLDEPTNDLDIPTLEVMEQSLKEFSGAVVLITHDRCLMDSLCTKILGLGEGNEQQFYADYQQWEQASALNKGPKEQELKKQETKKNDNKKIELKVPENKVQVNPQLIPPSSTSKKLSYKEQKELENMEVTITLSEQKITEFQLLLENAEIQSSSHKTLEIYNLLAIAEKKLEDLYARWQVLLEKSSSERANP